MKICTLDLETDGLLDECRLVWCAVVKDHETGILTDFVFADGSSNCDELFDHLDTYDVVMTHNGLRFDWAVLRKLYEYEYKGKKVDTLQMSRLQRPNRVLPPNCTNRRVGPHSVEAWGWRVGRGKVSHDQWDRFSPAMLERCREDVEIQYLIYHKLLDEGRGESWADAHRLTFRLMDLLQRVEEYGWRVDIPYMKHCVITLTRWIMRIDRVVVPLLPMVCDVLEIKAGGEYKYVTRPFKKNGDVSASVARYLSLCADEEEGDVPLLLERDNVLGPFSRVHFRTVNLNSNSEVKDYLLSQGWVPDRWNLNNEGERTSPVLSKDDSFTGIQSSLGKLVSRRVQCRQRRSIIEGWFTVVRPDGRIPSIVTGLAVTGRARHKNVVNVPSPSSFFGSWMRRIFISDDDKILVGCDSDANQVRMLCARMNDDEYTKAVLEGKKEDGTDIHSVNMRAAGLPSRSLAKTFFYGILFGAGDAKTGRIISGSPTDGKALKAKLFEGLPALGTLISSLEDSWYKTARRYYDKQLGRTVHKNGWLMGLDGRPIKIDSPHKLLVYMLQSDEAIHMSYALVTLYDWLTERGYVWGRDYGIVCWYHDEWTIECLPEYAKEIGRLSSLAMKHSAEHYDIACPHHGNPTTGRTWADIH